MISRRDERRRQIGKDAAAIVVDARRLAVHRDAGPHDLGAVGGADALVSQANAEDRNAAAKAADQVGGHAGLGGRAGAWRDDDPLRRERRDLIEGNGVISTNERLAAQLAHVAGEVVDERVVVVDEQNHEDAGCVGSRAQRCAGAVSARASMSARALSRVSRYSCSGSESATMPPPTLKYTVSPSA